MLEFTSVSHWVKFDERGSSALISIIYSSLSRIVLDPKSNLLSKKLSVALIALFCVMVTEFTLMFWISKMFSFGCFIFWSLTWENPNSKLSFGCFMYWSLASEHPNSKLSFGYFIYWSLASEHPNSKLRFGCFMYWSFASEPPNSLNLVMDSPVTIR